jgi:hypothetical protein
MEQNAHARGAAPGAADVFPETIAEKSRAQPVTRQVSHPILLSMLRARPEPKPEVTAHDERRWQRDARRKQAVRWLRHVPSHPSAVAELIGVSPRAVMYWRRGERAPTIRNWSKIRALHALCRRDMWGARL